MSAAATDAGKSKLRLYRADLIPVLLLALAVFASLSFAQNLFGDGDTSWHLATGRYILEHRSVPTTDPFSFTAFGTLWTTHEWLGEVLMAQLFAIACWAGLGMLFAFAVALLLVMVGVHLTGRFAPRHVVAILVALFILLVPAVLARPHVLAWPILAAWTICLLRARQAGRSPPVWLVLLMLLWANVHASFLFGFVIAGLLGLEALIEEKDRWRTMIGWGILGLLSLLAALLTPSGLQGILYPFQVSSMKALVLIEEWRPSSLSRDPLFFGVSTAAALLLLVRRPRISLPRLALLALLFYLAVSHARHQALFGIVGLLVIADAFARMSLGTRPEPASLGRNWRTAALFAVAVVIAAIVRLAVDVPHKDSATTPSAAIAAVPQSLRSQPVFNSYSFGGPLIWNGIRPFIDGRSDMYGDDFTFAAKAMEDGDPAAFRRGVERWKIRWTILRPDSRLVRLLDRDPQWRRIYSDKWAVVHAAR